MRDATLICSSNLSKRFDIYKNPSHRLWNFIAPQLKTERQEFWALKDINFTINRGETVAIVGRNGSGKSTLLQLVCSILRPTTGHVQVNGRIAALLELGSGFNPQFSGRENVVLYASILGMARHEIESRYEDIVKFADIGRFIDYPLGTYSSGMIVRLAFATAIHVSPDLLVVDEALAVGDTAFQQKCLMRIRQMQSQGVSILLVTHSSNTVIEYCDRAIYLRQGMLIADGSTAEIVKQYSADLVNEEMRDIDPSSRSETISREKMSNQVVAYRDAKPQSEITSVEMHDVQGHPSSTYEFGEQITIIINVVTHSEIGSPCCGIQLSSVDGIVLWSCTTQSGDFQFPPTHAGKARLVWKLTANFSGNRYVLSVGVGAIVNGEYKRSHRLEYAAHFDVLPQPGKGSGWLAPLPSFFSSNTQSSQK